MRNGPVVAASVLLPLLVAACRADPATPRGTAELFLDAHYVRIDLSAAHALTSGVARSKLEDEMRLTAGQSIDETTRKPTVHYRLLEERRDGEAAVNYVYRGRIAVEDADTFERRWLLTVRFADGAWSVTNYQELGG
jgi:hypothetical protein